MVETNNNDRDQNRDQTDRSQKKQPENKNDTDAFEQRVMKRMRSMQGSS